MREKIERARGSYSADRERERETLPSRCLPFKPCCTFSARSCTLSTTFLSLFLPTFLPRIPRENEFNSVPGGRLEECVCVQSSHASDGIYVAIERVISVVEEECQTVQLVVTVTFLHSTKTLRVERNRFFIYCGQFYGLHCEAFCYINFDSITM